MEMGDQLRVPAALLPVKEPLFALDRKPSGPRAVLETMGRGTEYCLCWDSNFESYVNGI
jgi:hypothetical protein